MSLGKPVGKLEAPRVRSRVTLAPRTMPQIPPGRHEIAWVGLATAVITDVAPHGELTRKALPQRIEDAIAARARDAYREGLLKRGLGLAHAAAMTYLGECVPPGAYFAGVGADRAATALPAGALRRTVTAAPAGIHRLGWSPDGEATGALVLDRLHYAWLGDLLLNDWMRLQVAADLALGAHLAPGSFAGVRVIATETMARSLHVRPNWTTHLLGGCVACRPGGVLGVTAVRHLQVVEPERLSDGRLKGDHGNRALPSRRRILTERLVREYPAGTVLPPDVLAEYAELAGVTAHTVQRWRREALQRAAKETANAARTNPYAVDEVVLYKSNKVLDKGVRTGWIPSSDLLKQLDDYSTYHLAWETLSADPAHELAAVSRSTFYAGLDRLHNAVKTGELRGLPAMRKHTLTVPRRIEELVNACWSLDEYTIKVIVRDPLAGIDEPLELHLAVVRDEWDGLPLAARRWTTAPTAADLASLVGEAVLGWEHDGVHVGGAAARLRCDQGSPINSTEGRRRLGGVGMTIALIGSYWPDANGGHERDHRDYGLRFQMVPGATTGPQDRTGRCYDLGLYATLAEVDEVLVSLLDDARFGHRPDTVRHAGRTRFEMRRDCIEQGLVAGQFDLTDENVAELAVPLGERLANERTGVEFRKHRYLSRAFEQVGYSGQVIVAGLHPGDDAAPETLYAFTDTGDFIALLYRDDALPEYEIAGILEDRAARRSFVEAGQKTRRRNRKNRTNLPPQPAPTGVVPTQRTGSLDPAPAPAGTLLAALADTPEVQALLDDLDLLTAVRALSSEDLEQLRGRQELDIAADDQADVTPGSATGDAPARDMTGALAAPDAAAQPTPDAPSREVPDTPPARHLHDAANPPPHAADVAIAPSTRADPDGADRSAPDTTDPLLAALARGRTKKEQKP
ncbi:hypothetical protein [Blastococcus sp. SYSU DS1024]